MGASFAEIEFARISLCQGRANLRQITIRHYESIENVSEIMSLIEKMDTIGSCKTDRSVVSCTSLVGADNSEKMELSVFSEENKSDRRLDSNFSLVPENDNLFSYDQMVLGQFNSSKTAFDISAMCQNTVKRY